MEIDVATTPAGNPASDTAETDLAHEANSPVAVDEVLRAIAEPTRWRIIELLAGGELCVCHIVDELDARQPLVSHHLKVLREAGVVQTSPQGTWIWYRLVPAALASLADVLSALHNTAASATTAGASTTRRRSC